uniref:Uncharacterized protein n=1 Tax=Kalanchoe fedtschenkoi TaxID=63787 RepID=A0A7N0TW23_KALFE
MRRVGVFVDSLITSQGHQSWNSLFWHFFGPFSSSFLFCNWSKSILIYSLT